MKINEILNNSLKEATGDEKFDRMMGKVTKGAELEPEEQQFIQRYEQLLNKLGKLGETIVKNPVAWKRYQSATENGDEIDSLYHLIEKYTGASREELDNLDSIVDGFGTTESGMLEFAWAVKEGRWENDFMQPWEEYKLSFSSTGEGVSEGSKPLKINDRVGNLRRQGHSDKEIRDILDSEKAKKEQKKQGGSKG